MLFMHTYINTYLKGEFRLIMIIFNGVLYFCQHVPIIDLKIISMTVFDLCEIEV